MSVSVAETWAERQARLQSESPDERRERQLADYDHNHDVTGHFLNRESYTPDGSQPRDPLSGVYLGPETRPWHHFAGHPDYEPHPASIAATQ
ncbi:hypothetical protein MRBLWO14_002822 [Microbacterium sp. LWO14-1.2]|uniref:hypothetical protein n=1 Tax=Microbacterium sp. LWO14-1.2 TaxID=3135263 RepID=UPI003138E623